MKHKLLISLFAASMLAMSPAAVADDAVGVVDGQVLLTLPPDSTVVEHVDLSGNMRLSRTASNTILLAPIGTQLAVVEGDGGPQLAMAIPDPAEAPTPGWTNDSVSDVVRRVAAGETFERIQAEFPVNVTTAAAPGYEELQNEACLYGSPAQEKYGFIQSCTSRRNVAQDATYRWTTSASWTYAQSNQSNLRVTKIANKDTYASDEPIQSFTPMDVIKDLNNCTTYGLSLTYKAVNVSMSKNVCPDQIVPNRTVGQTNAFQTTWTGKEVAAHTEQIEGARGPVKSGNKMVQTGTAVLSAKCSAGLLCKLPFFYD